MLFVFPLVLVGVPIAVIAVGGVVLSPVAGLISGRLARRRGLDSRRFAVIGVGYSAMLGFPWVFLVFGMRGWNIPRFLIRALYVILYAAWLLLCVPLMFSAVIGPGVIFGSFYWMLVVLLGIISIVGWLVSLINLRITSVESLAKWGDPEKGTVPYARYIQPFAWMTLITVLLLILFMGGHLWR